MGLIDSVLGLAFVVGAGWFVIYYLVPKFESGEFNLGTVPKQKEEESAQTPAVADVTQVLEDIVAETEKAVGGGEEKKGTKKKKKEAGEWLSSDLAGKDNRKKKSEKEYRVISWYLEPGY